MRRALTGERLRKSWRIGDPQEGGGWIPEAGDSFDSVPPALTKISLEIIIYGIVRYGFIQNKAWS